jgi:hypothetical protein
LRQSSRSASATFCVDAMTGDNGSSRVRCVDSCDAVSAADLVPSWSVDSQRMPLGA